MQPSIPRHKFIKKILFFTYLLAITLLSLWPSADLPNVILFPNADKLIHCCMYAGLTFLALWTWPEHFTGNKQFLPLLAVLLWGFSMEVLQGLTHMGRSFDLKDELANTLGFFPGWVLWRWKKILFLHKS
jgi:VanZ family protein